MTGYLPGWRKLQTIGLTDRRTTRKSGRLREALSEEVFHRLTFAEHYRRAVMARDPRGAEPLSSRPAHHRQRLRPGCCSLPQTAGTGDQLLAAPRGGGHGDPVTSCRVNDRRPALWACAEATADLFRPPDAAFATSGTALAVLASRAKARDQLAGGALAASVALRWLADVSAAPLGPPAVLRQQLPQLRQRPALQA